LRVPGVGFRVQGSGFRVPGFGLRVRVQSLGFRVQGSENLLLPQRLVGAGARNPLSLLLYYFQA